MAKNSNALWFQIISTTTWFCRSGRGSSELNWNPLTDHFGAGESRMASAVTNWFCFMKFISVSSGLARECSHSGGGNEGETGEERREEGERREGKGKEKERKGERECVQERDLERKRDKEKEREHDLLRARLGTGPPTLLPHSTIFLWCALYASLSWVVSELVSV